jgi:hypothetical protein
MALPAVQRAGLPIQFIRRAWTPKVDDSRGGPTRLLASEWCIAANRWQQCGGNDGIPLTRSVSEGTRVPSLTLRVSWIDRPAPRIRCNRPLDSASAEVGGHQVRVGRVHNAIAIDVREQPGQAADRPKPVAHCGPVRGCD